MQDFDRLNRIAKSLQERYPRGTRIVLLSMGNDPNPILPGTRGTVNVVDDIGKTSAVSSFWTSVSRNCLTGGLCMEKSLTKPVRSSALTVSDGYLRIRLPGTTLTVGIVRTTKSGQRRRIPFPMKTRMSTSNCGVIPKSSMVLQASSAIICWNRTIRKKEV